MKSIRLAAAFAMAAAMLASCSEEQSTFNIENVPGRCTLEGKIVYNQGTTYENGKFVYDYKPAANIAVTVTVNNREYNSSLEGESYFTTVTDENGAYSIEIPAPRGLISATVTTADFRTTQSIVKVENNKIVTSEQEVILRADKTFFNIHSEGIVLASLECTTCNTDNSFTGFSEYATLNGLIGQNIEYTVAPKLYYDEFTDLFGYTNGQLYYCFTGASKADLILNVTYPNQSGTFTYNTTTDNAGKFTFSVPVESFPASFSYTITVLPYDGKFTQYEAVTREMTNGNTFTDYVAHSLDGFYSQSSNETFYASYPVAAQTVSMESKAMVFSPYNNGQELYGYSASNFSSSSMWLDDLIEMLNSAN